MLEVCSRNYSHKESEGEEMIMRERMARAMCVASKTDPDHICHGLGDLMPNDTTYPAWHYQAMVLDAAIDAASDESMGMSGKIIQAGIDANEIPPSGSVCDIFRAMIRAVKEEGWLNNKSCYEVMADPNASDSEKDAAEIAADFYSNN